MLELQIHFTVFLRITSFNVRTALQVAVKITSCNIDFTVSKDMYLPFIWF